jgi:hypothetical protein
VPTEMRYSRSPMPIMAKPSESIWEKSSRALFTLCPARI